MLEIRAPKAGEREEIAGFLHDRFKAKIPLPRWRGLVSSRWSPAPYGVCLFDASALVGFLAVVQAERAFEGGTGRTGNMSSWYLDNPYRGRGLGLDMLRWVTADPGLTVTNFSSVPHAVRTLEKAGLAVLDARRLVWRAERAGEGPAVRVLDGGAGLEAGQVRLLADHKGLNFETRLVETADGERCLLLLAVKRKHDDYVTYEVLHLGNPAVFARHARAIAGAVLPPRDAVLSVDSRFIAGEADPDAVETFAVPRFATPGLMPPAAVDFLYSETVVLDLKLY